MNAALKSASERYNKISNKDYLIHPMSEVDLEIFIELGQALKKAGIEDLILIIKEYKKVKDAEIRDNLMQWHIDHPTLGAKKLVDKIADKIIKEADAEDEKYAFFELGHIMIFERQLLGLKKYERIDKQTEDYVYGLIINPMPENHNMKSVPMFADEKIEYSSEEKRNTVLENLSAFLRDKDIDIIDLEIDE